MNSVAAPSERRRPTPRGAPRATRVAIGGAPLFGRRMASLLGGDGWEATFLETRGWRPDAALRAVVRSRRADVHYHLGGQLQRLSRPDLLHAVARRPCVMHWTGSDVIYARGEVERGRVSERLRRGCVHWAGAPWLVDELAELGVMAEWVPHSTVMPPAEVPPFGERFTVLSYLRPDREEFYGVGAVLRVALALPGAEVLIAGVDRLERPAPANVQCLGWVEDMAPLYTRAHVLLRMPAHDGLSFMVQEALAYGRHAVWRYPMEGVVRAADEDEACARVAELAEHHRAGDLPLNLEGARFVAERFSEARIRDDLRRRLATVAGRGSP